jgi:spore maturation protein CgeB
MKLLVACSSLDLKAPFSATPAWWQLLKALHETGVDLAVTTYQGRSIHSPWWRAYPNPTRVEGDLYAAVRDLAQGLNWRARNGSTEPRRSPVLSWLTTLVARAVIAPRWSAHLMRILAREGNVDAVLLISVPPNHLQAAVARIKSSLGLPVLFYDGDFPASLPAYGGFASGFDIYRNAELDLFDIILTNSKGAEGILAARGARTVRTLYYAADPALFHPIPCQKDIDVLFYGHTAEYRQGWLSAMLTEPAGMMPDRVFTVRGRRLGHLKGVSHEPYGTFTSLPSLIARSRINLVIVREPQAKLHGSSISRPFELAMMGSCMVSNPWDGVEEWFEPGKEIIVVHSAEEATDRYRYLLTHPEQRRAVGRAARKRALQEHTYQNRATDLVRLIESTI